MAAALAKGNVVALDQVGLFADGVAVRKVGTETFRLCRDLLDEVVTVDTDAMCAAIKDIFDDTRSIAEPAGALELAGLKKYVEREVVRDQTLLAIDSGANTNFDRLRHISERTEIGEKREAVFSVTIPEMPGSFRAFCGAIGRGRAITEFNYRYADTGAAHIFVGVQVAPGGGDRQMLVEDLHQKGYPVVDLTDNEMAKLHVRYMVGGHAPVEGLEEIVYRFEFPERPGALLNFLNTLDPDWNISMFHYRNQGADYSRVLVGLQVPRGERRAFSAFLSELGYRHWDETENPAYRLFLAAS
jgi:threonine dehydratase